MSNRSKGRLTYNKDTGKYEIKKGEVKTLRDVPSKGGYKKGSVHKAWDDLKKGKGKIDYLTRVEDVEEEVEQLDELSTDTLQNYTAKSLERRRLHRQSLMKTAAMHKKDANREKGVKRATAAIQQRKLDSMSPAQKKFVKKGTVHSKAYAQKESVEYLDEAPSKKGLYVQALGDAYKKKHGKMMPQEMANKLFKMSIAQLKQKTDALPKGATESVEEGTADPKLAAQLAKRKAQRAKNAERAKAAAKKKAAAAKKPKQTRAPRKNKSDIRDASERNIIMQLRKAQDVGGKHEIEFRRDKGTLDKGTIDILLKVHDRLQKPDDKRRLRVAIIQNSAAAKKVAQQFKGKV